MTDCDEKSTPLESQRERTEHFNDRPTEATHDTGDVLPQDACYSDKPALEACQEREPTRPDENTRGGIVDWEGPDDPENPRNWTRRRKWAASLIVAAFNFMSAFSSSIVAPAVDSIGQELEIRDQSLANLFYAVFTVIAGFSRNTPQIIVCRFLAGLGGSAPLTVGGAVIGDLWHAKERGGALALYSMGPLLGPAMGAIIGSFIAQYTTWRWALWAPAIAYVFVQLLGLFYLRETYAPKILHSKLRRVRKEATDRSLTPMYEDPSTASLWSKLKVSMPRLFVLITTQPIIQCLGLFMAYLYGLTYLVIGSIPLVFEVYYGEPVAIAGLHYIPLGIGLVGGVQLAFKFNDRIYQRLKAKYNTEGRPEYRLPLMVLGSILVPVGQFWYGWSAQAHVHWIVPDIGMLIWSTGGMLSFNCIQVYIADAYTLNAASALAAASFLRSLCAFAFPLFATHIYQQLGVGWASSVFALIALAIGVPSPWLFFSFGKALRARSQYAAGGDT